MSDHTTTPPVAVITRYDIPPLKEKSLATVLDQAVRNWICKRPGFVSGTVHTSLDQSHVVVYTLWDREEDAIHCLDGPEARELWDAIRNSGSRLRDSESYWVGPAVLSPAKAD